MPHAGDVLLIASVAIVLLVSLAVHEASHAFAADQLGDSTPRQMGRLTLNPIAHLDPAGTIAIIVSSLAGFGIGWGKPVSINPNNLRRGFLVKLDNGPLVGMAIVALAGPVSNVILAIIGAQLLSTVGEPSGIASAVENMLLRQLVIVNVTLAVFNLIPIPPLDGYRVLLGLLPTKPAYTLARLEPYGMGILLLLVFLGQGVLDSILMTFSVPLYHLIGAYGFLLT